MFEEQNENNNAENDEALKNSGEQGSEDKAENDVVGLGEQEWSGRIDRPQKKISATTFFVSAVALILAAVMITFSCCSSFYKKKLAEARLENITLGSSEEYNEIKLLDSIFKAYAYSDLDDDKLVEAVLRAYVAATGDAYAEYYNEEEYEALKASNSGASEGIGINIINSTADINGKETKVIQVISVSPDSPAEKAGLRIGDLIVWSGIGEKAALVDDLGYTAAMSGLKGAAGTVAEFTIMRPLSSGGYEKIEFSIERKKIEATSVYASVSEADPKIGIVKISQFDLTVPKQFSAAVDKLKNDGCDKFVFDVRYNPGGDLRSIVAVLSYFLDEGDVVISTVDKEGTKEITKVESVEYEGEYETCSISKEDIGKYKGMDMVVLCNESTASAAELFTAAMRDYELADIVGATTYGKGSMQSIISLEYFGYKGAVKLTTRMYFPPCGESYNDIGIKPDVEVALSDAAKEYNVYVLPQSLDDQLQAAFKLFD